MNIIPDPSPRDQEPERRWIETGTSAREDAERRLDPRPNDRKRAARTSGLSFPLLRDDLSSMTVVVSLAHEATTQQVSLGTLRSASVSPEEVTFFAKMTAARHALLRTSYGGAAAGLAAIPPALERNERERLHRRLIRELAAKKDGLATVLLTDVDQPDDETLWLADEAHIRRSGEDKLSPRERADGLACLPIPRATVGEGLRILLEEALRTERTEIRGARIGIHGNGPLTQAASIALARAGARIVAVSDGPTTFYHPTGLDARIIPQIKSERGPIRIPGMLALPTSSLLNVPCEAILLTRPLPRVGPQTARRINTRIVLEADDGLLSPEADAHLLRHRARVVPDIIGRLPVEILADIQWQQYVNDTRWRRTEVETQLDTQLRETYARVDDLAENLSTTLRRAAHILASEHEVTPG